MGGGSIPKVPSLALQAKGSPSRDGEVAEGGLDLLSTRCAAPRHVRSLPVVTPASATMSNEVTVAWSGVGAAREGWRITGNRVGAGEQRKGKFDTNSSVLPPKSSQCSAAKILLWLGLSGKLCHLSSVSRLMTF